MAGKHRAGQAEGSSTQKAEAQKAKEAAELKALEDKLRKAGKIK